MCIKNFKSSKILMTNSFNRKTVFTKQRFWLDIVLVSLLLLANPKRRLIYSKQNKCFDQMEQVWMTYETQKIIPINTLNV